MVRLEQLGDVAKEFVLVRLLKIAGYDLSLFDFDYDLTWAGFFLNANERIYGRYGGRDASGPDGRLSLAGLRYAMEQALAVHRREPAAGLNPAARKESRLKVEDYPAARRMKGNECIHCHQVYEFRRDALKQAGTWKKDEVFVYPLPENVGLTLDVNQGNRVRSVAAKSPAERAGLQAGDVLSTLNHVPVASIADAQHGLHRAPARGPIPLTWQRDGKSLSTSLEVPDGWRRTNITWRPSLLEILPSLSLFGDDLTVEEKKSFGLSPQQLAFRQDMNVPRDLAAAGVLGGDIVLGIDGQPMEMTMQEFLGHVRRNYLIGERVTLNLLRNGKRVDVGFTLR